LASERLGKEVRNHAAIVDAHPRSVRVEDADDAGVESVGAVVGHGERLPAALALVIGAARSDRVHVAPVRLGLRVDEGVAVDLRGRGEEKAGLLGPGQAEQVVGAQGPDLDDLDRDGREIGRRRGRREVEHHLHRSRDGDPFADVVILEMEAGPVPEPVEVAPGRGDEVVEDQHLEAAIEKLFAEVGADETGAARDDGPS